MSNYGASDYEDIDKINVLEKKVQLLTSLLDQCCEVMGNHPHVSDAFPKALSIWWDTRKGEKQKELQQLKEQGLAKLTLDEQRALGLKE